MDYVVLGVTVLGVLVTLGIYLASRKPKQLNYYMRSSQPLLARGSSQHRHQVQILVDGKPADRPVSSVFRLENSGKVDIKPEDYVEPIKIHLRNARVLGLSTRTGPREWTLDSSKMQAHISRGTNRSYLELPAMYLDEGDYLDVQVLTDEGEVPSPEVTGRLAGTKLIQGAPRVRFGTKASAESSGRSAGYSWLALLAMAALLPTAAVAVVVLPIAGETLKVVPDVREQQVGDAIQILNKEGFHTGDINRVPSSEAPGTVLDQSPAAPTEADPEEGVSLVIAE